MADRPHIKIEIRAEVEDDVYVETPWAVPLGNNRYRLDNIPFYAYGLSWGDVVEAEPREHEQPLFSKVVEKSGHKTMRVILDPPADQSEDSQAVLSMLQKLGCTYEGVNNVYIAVDIPPDVDLQAVTEYLMTLEQDWEHADPRHEELYSVKGQ